MKILIGYALYSEVTKKFLAERIDTVGYREWDPADVINDFWLWTEKDLAERNLRTVQTCYTEKDFQELSYYIKVKFETKNTYKVVEIFAEI